MSTANQETGGSAFGPAPCSVFLLDKLPWDADETVRICISGIDKGAAVYLESRLDMSRTEAIALLPKIVDALRHAVVDYGDDTPNTGI